VEASFEHGNEPWSCHKMMGSSWVATQLAASQEGLSSRKLVFLPAFLSLNFSNK
jgi:hypothetical protein